MIDRAEIMIASFGQNKSELSIGVDRAVHGVSGVDNDMIHDRGFHHIVLDFDRLATTDPLRAALGSKALSIPVKRCIDRYNA